MAGSEMTGLDAYIEQLVEQRGSDLYLTAGMPPCLRVTDDIQRLSETPLTGEDVQRFVEALLNEEQVDEFQSTLEFNASTDWHGRARLRINVMRQQQLPAIVIRRIQTDIPQLESLQLPEAYQRLVMMKRGLVLVVGPTGSGKSTSLAAMIDHRNQNGSGHIITVEDPIEFVHRHKGCIITQRDVGIDTYSFGIALKNALRQRPDVVMIGEIRDRETMEQALTFAETGHLCLATLHAHNANQTIERILSFFPEDKHRQVLMHLSMNLRGVLSQRLLTAKNGKRCVAVEVLLNEGLIRSLIQEGRAGDIKPLMQKHRDLGMQTFDQSLLDLYAKGLIDEATAMAEADNVADLRLNMRRDQFGKETAPSPLKPALAASPFRQAGRSDWVGESETG